MFVSFNTDVIWFNYRKPLRYRFTGQWALINCTCNHQCDQRANISLWFGVPGTSFSYELPVGTEKIELVTKDAFNITHLALNNTGFYICLTAFWSNNTTITKEKTIYPLEVLRREGNTYKL